MKPHGLARGERVRRSIDFDRIHRHGYRARGRFLTLLVAPNNTGRSRLGIAAGRRLGSAVVRNRVKRQVRELFRRHKPDASVDLVVIPRSELLEAEFKTLEADYRSTLRRCLSSGPSAARTPHARRQPGVEGARGL